MDVTKVANRAVTSEQRYLHVRCTSDSSDFAALRDEWQVLLERSRANPLFLSWAWLWSWWSEWHKSLSLELNILTVRDDSGKLLGIAPLYRQQIDYAGLTRFVRLQCIGNAWKTAPTVRSEYISFIADQQAELDVYQAIWHYLNSDDSWNELVICDIDIESREFRLISALSRLHGYLLRPVSYDSGVKIPFSGSFENYLSSLGRSTRLKIFNRRKRLLEMGEISSEEVASTDYPMFFEVLNKLHATRWGKGCYVGPSERFHLRLLSYLQPEQIHCQLLKQRGEVISALYDLEVGGCRYNLQAGYLEAYHAKVSLGTLHLGYALEQACLSPSCDYYDLLAGSGKHSFYKQHLGRELTHFVTLQIVRSPKFWQLYPWLEKLPSKWRRWLKKADK